MSPIQSISGGEPLGMLYIVHQDIRPAYADAHLSTLLANHAALAIEQIRHWELQEKQRSIAKELAVARDIQTSTLAGCKPEYPGWSFAVRYEAARAVGGDFYDFINLPQGQLGLAVADIAGKGVPAALMMSLSRTMLRAVAPSRTAACQTLEEVNRLLLEESRKDRFVSMFYGILNPHTGSLSYARAGHNPPLYWSQYNEAVSSLSGRGIVLGVTPDPHLEQRQITMGSGDVAVFFTDGITEASNGAMEAYGEERLAHWLMANHDLAAEAMADSLMDELKAFTGPKSLDDDLTLVILKRLNSH